jgi:hypothetical protein
MDETRKVGNIILTIVVLIALGFGIYYLVSKDRATAVNEPLPGSNYYVSVVQLKHQFKNGVHTYVGSLDLPNACYALDSYTERTSDISAVINLVTSEDQEEMCAQAVTSRDFRHQINAPISLTVTGMLNGKAVELNIFEVPADQDIDQFEINVKG